MNKIKLQPGDVLLSIGVGLLTLSVQILSWPLLRIALKHIFGHVAVYVGNNTTFEASTAGVTYYKLSDFMKCKRLVVIRFDQLSDPEMQKKLIRAIRKKIAQHKGYGYVNYPLWWIVVSPFILLPVMVAVFFIFKSWILLFYSFVGLLILYFPVSWYLRKVQRDTEVCSEAKVRLWQEDLGIDQGCKNPESWKPNNEYDYAYKAKDAQIIADFDPRKEWILEEAS